MTWSPYAARLPLWILSALAASGCSSTSPLTTTVTSGTQYGVTANAGNVFFDMQGIIWRMPPGGGQAVALTDARDDLSGMQLSPDGRWLAAQSFATGAWDIVIMRTDGTGRRNLTASPHDDTGPAWSADGKSLYFTSDRAGNEDIWSVRVDGGEPVQLTTDSADDYAPAAMGSDVVFVSDRGGKPGLYRLKPETGVTPVSTGSAPGAAGQGQRPGNTSTLPAHAPRASPDGRHIAFVRTVQRNGFPSVAIHELALLDTTTGTVRTLSTEGSDVFPMPPAWLDANTLLATMDGRIQRFSLAPEGVSRATLPFSADLPLRRSTLRPATPLAFSQARQAVRGIVDPVMLPGDAIVFTALGDLWRMDTSGRLSQLTNDSFVERDVAVSPDGRQLAFISDRGGTMQVWLYELDGGATRELTDRAAGPRYPTFSPDGSRLAFQEVGPRGTQDFTLRLITLAPGPDGKPAAPVKLRSSPAIWPGRMSFSTDGTHITVAELHRTSGRLTDGRNRLVRINLATDTATPMELPGDAAPDSGPVASPDGRQLALVIDGALWTVPVTADGQLEGTPVQVLDELVESPAFSPDGRRVAVLTNRGLEVVDVAGAVADARTGNGAINWRVRRDPDMAWQAASGNGEQLIHAGRLWDGSSTGYLYDVDIVISDARITSIRPHATHPPGVAVLDAGSHTVLPGLMDHHVHFEPHKGEQVGRALLAFGITTVVEPGGLPYESREHMESWLSGRRPGPRLVFAGPQLDGARRTFNFASHINSERRLEQELERGERLGYGFLKTYRRMRPSLQARTVQLGHERGWPVTAHAGLRNLGFGGDRTEHLRGSDRVVNSPKQSDLLKSYEDVLAIYTLPGVAITPTLVNQGGFFDFALRFPELMNTAQYQALYPPADRNNLAAFTRVVGRNIGLVRTGLGNAGATLRQLDRQGGNIVAGTDSPIFPYGLALVMELQGYVDAGLTPAAALRTATSNAARAMGAVNEAGRISPGLLADVLIVDGDPLQRVTDLLNVEGVMLNGRYSTLEALLEPAGQLP